MLSFKRLMVKDADVRWNDRAVQTAANISLKADVELDQMSTAHDAAPAQFKISAQIAGIIEQAAIDGTIAASPDSAAIKLAVNATGIHEGQLVSYLPPPGTHIALKDGRFRTTLDASVAPHPDGGNQLSVRVADLDYRDGAAGPTLLKFDSAGIVAARIDPQGGIIAIDEIALAGLETGMTKAAADRTQLLGLEIGPPPHNAAFDGRHRAGTATAPCAQSCKAPASAARSRRSAACRRARKALPLITVEKDRSESQTGEHRRSGTPAGGSDQACSMSTWPAARNSRCSARVPARGRRCSWISRGNSARWPTRSPSIFRLCPLLIGRRFSIDYRQLLASRATACSLICRSSSRRSMARA